MKLLRRSHAVLIAAASATAFGTTSLAGLPAPGTPAAEFRNGRNIPVPFRLCSL
jgi:hypothetical protein